MSPSRIVIGAAGVALGLFGVFRLLTQIDVRDLLFLLLWLVGALILHDGVIAPAVLSTGRLLTRIPPRARGYVQGGLLAGALITVIAIPMIYRRDSQPRVKAILQQNFGLNLLTLLAIVLAATLVLYVIRLVRDRQAVSVTNVRPPDDHSSATE